jgi:hypothetical protein
MLSLAKTTCHRRPPQAGWAERAALRATLAFTGSPSALCRACVAKDKRRDREGVECKGEEPSCPSEGRLVR